ncbi:hypothetical protein KIPB_004250 [Kipferlia bialata]|uniref:SET domain-containing protein n=1 Tax=Kipferlia bialata TaxID=797122 RepID=A0A9K3GHB3_9EUKA|nr:hypothetical protein KIPB_004250 [Kipferlia bialata]|eukprot:g4250.t1
MSDPQAGQPSEETIKESVKWEGLAEAARSQFGDLCDNTTEGEGEKTFLGIMESNGFSVGDEDDSTQVGVCLVGARFNHSCVPNVSSVLRQDANTLEQRTYANEAIPCGTELTVSYVDMTLTHTERRAALQSKYHFDCTCPVCTMDSKAISERDAALTNLKTLRTATSDSPAEVLKAAVPIEAIITQHLGANPVELSSLAWEALTACAQLRNQKMPLVQRYFDMASRDLTVSQRKTVRKQLKVKIGKQMPLPPLTVPETDSEGEAEAAAEVVDVKPVKTTAPKGKGKGKRDRRNRRR